MPHVNIFTTHYAEVNAERARELRICISINSKLRSVDRVVVLDDSPQPLESSGKLLVRPVARRPKFDDMFRAVAELSGNNDLNIVCNTDIFLSERTVRLARKQLKQGQCFVLSRWDVQRGGFARLMSKTWSQDCWMFVGKPRQLCGDFFMGQLGCDNRLAYELWKAGYEVLNPAKTIRVFHLHQSNIRNYSKDKWDWVSGPHMEVALCAVGSPVGLWYARQRERVLYKLLRMVDPEVVRCRVPAVELSL